MGQIRHGTLSGYFKRGCRCKECRVACRDYSRRRRELGYKSEGRPRKYERVVEVDRDMLSDLLNELFPYGLTDEAPLARRKAAA